MEYLTRLVQARSRTTPPAPAPPRQQHQQPSQRRLNPSLYGPELLANFKALWRAIENQLQSPDQRALHHGISRTDIPDQLEDLVEALVIEYSHTDEEEVMGPCMEYCLQQDVFAKLVHMAAADKPEGIQRQVVRLFSSLVVLLDERFLSRQAINRPLARIMRLCVGDADVEPRYGAVDVPDDSFDEIEAESRSRYGRMGSAEAQGFEDDLVDLMCHVASRLRNSPELLIIFFRAEVRQRGEAIGAPAMQQPKESTPPPFAVQDDEPIVRAPSPASSTASTVTLRGPAATTDTAILEASQHDNDGDDSPAAQVSADFPLFSYLLRFAYREGRTGELARAGLLLLVDISMVSSRRQSRAASQRAAHDEESDVSRQASEASLSLALAEFMLSSDFAEVIGAGLGAVYGLLPSKLALVRPEQASQDNSTAEPTHSMLGSNMYLGRQSVAAEPMTDRQELLSRGIEPSDSPAVASQLKLFVALLDFTQDILGRIEKARQAYAVEAAWGGGGFAAPSSEHIVVASALEAQLIASIRSLFLESIVYPGLLESSETDGSAIAVMSYISMMLEVIDDESVLADAVIGWLLGAGDEVETQQKQQQRPPPTPPSRANAHRRSRSTALMQVQEDRNPHADSSYFIDATGRYTLKDLVLGHLTVSSTPEAKSAALWFSTTLLARHGRFALTRFLDVAVDDGATAFPFPFSAAMEKGEDDFVSNGITAQPPKAHTLWQHTQELEMYLSLVAILEQGEAGWSSSSFSSTGLDNYLSDAEDTLLADSTYQVGLRSLDRDGPQQPPARLRKARRRGSPSKSIGDSSVGLGVQEGGSMPIRSTDFPCFNHRLRPRDALLQATLDLLRHFFQQASEVNVGLTALLAQLAASPWRSMAGFLALEDEVVVSGVEGDDEESARRHRRTASKQPAPVVLGLLRSLVIQVERYRARIPGFDRFLQERRRGLLFVENLNDALGLKDDVGDGGAEGEMAAIKRGLSAAALEKLWDIVDVKDEEWRSEASASAIRFVELPARASASAPTSVDVPNTIAPAETPSLEAEPKREGSFARWFGRKSTPKANESVKPTSDQNVVDPSSESSAASSSQPPPMPFAAHYDETCRILLEPQQGRLPPGDWADAESGRAAPLRRPPAQAPEQTLVAPKPKKQLRFSRRLSYEGETSRGGESHEEDDEDVAYPGHDEAEEESASEPALSKEAEELKRSGVSLSTILDNVVILEESIKELVAMLHVRRSLGVDALTLMA